MAYSFAIEKENEEKAQNKPSLPNLTDAVIYCPKCGTMNSFIENAIFEDLVNHFCKKCLIRLNNYWNRYRSGDTTLMNCDMCDALTFDKLKYCVACGAYQDIMAKNQTKDVPEEITKDQKKKIRKNRRKSRRSNIFLFITDFVTEAVSFLSCCGFFVLP